MSKQTVVFKTDQNVRSLLSVLINGREALGLQAEIDMTKEEFVDFSYVFTHTEWSLVFV